MLTIFLILSTSKLLELCKQFILAYILVSYTQEDSIDGAALPYSNNRTR